MKKVWQIPTLEVLDINQTKGGFDSGESDGLFINKKGDVVPSFGSDQSYSVWTYTGVGNPK